MKIKDGFVIREVAGQWVVIPTEEVSEVFSGMIKLNCTAKDIWEALENEKTEEDIIEMLCTKYSISHERAENGVHSFLTEMSKHGFIEE